MDEGRGKGSLLGPTGHRQAASCCPLAGGPQGTQSHAEGPASLITGPWRPELQHARAGGRRSG